MRAGVFAVVATHLAALGHLMAGGALPDPAVLATVTVFLGGSLSGFTGRRRTGPQIIGALLISQFAFHLAFSLTAHPMAAEHGVGAGRMFAFHVLAALAAGAVMAGGESALFRLFAALHRVLLAATPPPPIGLSPRWTALIPTGSVGLRQSPGVLSAASRRGPPRDRRALPV